MYKYIFNKHVIVLTPFCTNASEIKTVMDIHKNYFHVKSTYPTGFILESTTYKDKVIVESNRELIDNKDGTVSVKN